VIELREVDEDVRAELIREVVVPDEQLTFVSSVEVSLRQAVEVPEANPWYRGLYDGGDPVGSVMIAWDVPPIEGLIGGWFLSKLLIDGDHQRQGYGQAVVGAIVDIVRANGGTELYTSYVDEPGGPKDFYARLGFVPAGEHGDEVLVVKAV
jgi:diamine N-acetyltransferase